MITANYATYPAPHRLNALERSIASIAPQVDLIRICWNNYTHIPSQFLKPNIEHHIPETDLTDNGKFHFLPTAMPDEIYLSCDDDIDYSHDYVRTLITPDFTINTMHGRVLNPHGGHSYYRGAHKCYSYLNETTYTDTVHIGGTGVMAINTAKFRPDVAQSPHKRMSDIVLSLEAARAGIPIQFIPHREGICKHIRTGQDTIANHFRKIEDEQVALLKEFFTIFAL